MPRVGAQMQKSRLPGQQIVGVFKQAKTKRAVKEHRGHLGVVKDVCLLCAQVGGDQIAWFSNRAYISQILRVLRGRGYEEARLGCRSADDVSHAACHGAGAYRSWLPEDLKNG